MKEGEATIAIMPGNKSVACPHCRQPVLFDWIDNAEFVRRCPDPCGKMFAIRTDGNGVYSGIIGVYSGIIVWDENKQWRPDATLREVFAPKAQAAPAPPD